MGLVKFDLGLISEERRNKPVEIFLCRAVTRSARTKTSFRVNVADNKSFIKIPLKQPAISFRLSLRRIERTFLGFSVLSNKMQIDRRH